MQSSIMTCAARMGSLSIAALVMPRTSPLPSCASAACSAMSSADMSICEDRKIRDHDPWQRVAGAHSSLLSIRA